jgi:hypothetical protein
MHDVDVFASKPVLFATYTHTNTPEKMNLDS